MIWDLGNTSEVQYLELNDENLIDIPLEISGDVEGVTVVVLGTTRYTRQVASYQFEFISE